MRKTTKIISKIILSVAMSILLILLGFYVWLHLRIDNVIDKKTYNYLVERINESEDLPDRFYEIYGQVTKYDENSTTNKYLFNRILDINYRTKNPCPCIDAGYTIAVSSTSGLYGFNRFTVGFALDKDASPKKCLDFYLSRFDFQYSARGIQNASQFYYQKELEQLSDDEMLELSIMTLNPSLYNKHRFPEKLREKVEEIKKSSFILTK